MNNKRTAISGTEEHLTSEEVKNKIRLQCEKIIKFCTGENEGVTFFQIEKNLRLLVTEMGCLFLQLFLIFHHEKLCYSKWTDTNLYYARKKPISRTIKTIFGEVKYWRTYLVKKESIGCGFHPLDSVLGLTRDGFSPFIISLATRLATRVSFGTTVIIFRCLRMVPFNRINRELGIGTGPGCRCLHGNGRAPRR